MSGIHEAIIAILRDIGAVGKDKKNAQQGFNFRGVDDAMNATHDLFAKHGVFVVPQVIERHREERTTKTGNVMYSTICRVKYSFFAADGSFIEAIIDGEGMDTADKSTSKAQAIAFKYALFQVLDIPTEDIKDPDAETPEATLPKGAGKAATTAQNAPAAAKASAATKPQQTPPAAAQPAGTNVTPLPVVLTKAQLLELYDLCTDHETNQQDPEMSARLKEIYTSLGYKKASEIKQSDFTRVKDSLLGFLLPDDLGEAPPEL
jgi:hypothetical protein